MYSYLTVRFKIIFIIGVIFLSLGSSVFGDELSDNIYSTFKRQFDGGSKDSFLETPYSSNFPKDPFIESFDDIEDMSRQQKIAGTEYIEKILAENGCSLHKKKIWSILYHFVPEFRSDLVQTMKIGLGDYTSRNFTFDRDKIIKYCNEYYICVNWKDLKNSEEVVGACKEEKNTFDECSKTCHEKCEKKKKEKQSDCFDSCYGRLITDSCLRQRYNYDKCIDSQKSLIVTADSAANVETNCKEFFEENYKQGKDSEQRKQKLQVSQVGFDKYRNSTTDDSPYDIMSDFGSIGRLLYTEAEQPITPVSYMLPMFSNSAKSLKDHKETGTSYSNGGESSNGGGGGGGGGVGGNAGNVGNSSSDPIPLKLPRDLIGGASMEDGYDDLIEGLGAFNVKQTNSQFYGSLCEDSEEEPEQESEDSDVAEPDILPIAPDLSDYSDEEVQELINYMKSAVDKYAALPEDKENEMKDRAGKIMDIERSARQIKDCWEGCKGLRIDQKASCMIMCTCGEIKSSDEPINLFNPEKFPGLGPIFVIRFCAVPATDTRFSKGGKKIVSIEEGVREIYGALDKLSREGRLGIWTQEYNFLDSSTKKMNMADTVAFSIDIEYVDIAGRFANHSEQYLKKEIKNANESWQRNHHISNNLKDPLFKNYYVIMADKGTLGDITNQSNAERTQRSNSNLSVESSSVVDLNSDSRASHYSKKTQLLDKWLDQQGAIWIDVLKYTEGATEKTKALDSKLKEP